MVQPHPDDSEVVDRGFLFFDGKYIERPYVFYQQGSEWYVNEYSLASLDYQAGNKGQPFPPDRNQRFGGRNEFGRRTARSTNVGRRPPSPDDRSPVDRGVRDVQSMLHSGGSAVCFAGFQPVTFDRTNAGAELIQRLKGGGDIKGTEMEESYKIGPVSEQARDHIEQWIASYEPSRAFLQNANPELKYLSWVNNNTQSVSESVLRLQRWSYPLTLFAMVLVVLGFGHLLSHRPSESDQGDQRAKRESDRLFRRSLLLIAGLSLLDLVWTILASQSGTMKELNPIGSGMIDDPLQLTAFKLFVTTMAIGLFYILRRAPLAQRASWWSCLVLTLVAARWLVFNSMFLS
ncbi:DUF5658 family protein [Novipirellula artificiosorum]|uniref:DUF5658 family protein n=1 Tax=Novipirellula artificiosorum TaxID=2528016 RepID=UPI0011B67895|nr:DUF5658 family protein [Novipirellula artificiosorum]